MKSNRMIIIPIVIGIAVLLAGCTVVPAPTATPQPTAAPTETVQPTETPVNTAIKAGEEYRYYTWTTTEEEDPFGKLGVRGGAIKKRTEEFEDKYGITVRYVPVSGGQSWEALPRSSAFSGNPVCDILNVGGPYVVMGTYFYEGSRGACTVNLNDYSDYATFDDPEFWDQRAQNACAFDGTLCFVVPNLIGMDSVLNNVATIFNADLMETAGYTAEDLYKLNNEGKWTWEEFEKACTAVTDADKGIYGTFRGGNNSFATALIASNNASYFVQEEVDGKMRDRFVGADEKIVEAWDFYIKLAHNGVLDYEAVDEESKVFTTQKVAMLVVPLQRIASLSEVKFSYGVLNPPKGPQASDYLSENNWFVPYSVMKGANNIPGSVQVLHDLFAPEYGINSEENQQMMEAELTNSLRDVESVKIAKDLQKYTSVQTYMLYHSIRDTKTTFSDYFYGYAWAYIRGDVAPAVNLEAIKGTINSVLDGYFNAD